MGYCMNMKSMDFSIDKSNFEGALKAIQALHGQETCDDHFSWVDDKFYEIDNLKDMLEEWRWKPYINSEGNICEIEFIGEKSGDEKFLFKAIAPFVENESYIHMRGEDGAEWKWVFIDGKLGYQKAIINLKWSKWREI